MLRSVLPHLQANPLEATSLCDALNTFDGLCLVMERLGTDVSSFRRSAPSKTLPVYTSKIIIAHIIDALVGLHDFNIIHTGAVNLFRQTDN